MAREERQPVKVEPHVVSPFDEMERMFEEVMGRPLLAPLFSRGRLPFRNEFTPLVNIWEEGDNVMVRAEIPGMRKEDLDVRVTGDAITISGERKQEEKIEERDFYRMESRYGSFQRTLKLPVEVETENAEASCRNGVLEIRLKKSAAAREKVKKIPIQ